MPTSCSLLIWLLLPRGMAQQLLVAHFGAFETSLVFFVLANELPECGLAFATRALLLVLSMGNGLATVAVSYTHLTLPTTPYV